MVIPDAVRATVLRRFGRLDRAGRTTLMQASAIGYRFHLRVLVAVGRASEARVRAALDGACELQLIVLEHANLERYAFRHALTRDIVYAEFGEARVRPLHRRIVGALEVAAAAGDVALADLAYHAWAGGDARRGVRYNERAGDDAAAVHAHDDARMHYGRALALVSVGTDAFLRLSRKLERVASG